VADLVQVLVLMAAPAAVLLTIRYLNLRDARSNTPNPTVDNGVHPDTYKV
jgi:hypothetical protein